MQGTLDNSIGDRFTEVVRLGDGAEGGTWRARDRRGRSVVLKRVVEGPRGDVTRAFEVLRRASSPHLPEALELLPDGKGGTWLVTAYVDGATLEAGPVPLAQALAEALGVALALESIHGLGTHHGDVSANNVICMPTRDVVLTDLGQLGRLGCGTPGFLAPEVLRGGGGPAADRFAVGCLLCLRIYGEVPWLRPEAVLGVTDGSHVRERLRALAASVTEPTPRPVTALLERLLDPEPHRRVAEAEQLVVRLRQLHRAIRAGELVEAQSAWWVPRRWGYIGSRAPVDAAVEALRDGGVGLVAVAGPEGSGRGRIVEEIVAALQLQRARSERRDGELALLCEAEGMAAALGSPESGGDWIAAWMGSRRGAPPRIWGLVEPAPWPEKMRGRPELQAAVLRAGLGLGEAPQPLVVPVSPALAQALRGEGVLVVERDPWTHAEVRACLTGVVEAVDAQRRAAELDAWSEAIHGATGGWPAKVIRAVEACARQGRTEHPERAVIEAALVSADSEARLEPERARGVLERRWGLDASEGEAQASEDGAQASADEASEPLASLVAAARASLGDSVPVLARATLEQRRRQGLAISLALALDADDAAAVEDTADQGALGSDLLAWLEAGGALRVGPRLRLRALRGLIRHGRPERALGLLDAVASTGRPSPAEALEGVRALEQLGRVSEALERLEELTPTMYGPDRDRALGLRWRALVDAGRPADAVAEAERWVEELGRPEPSWRRAVAWLWAALARIYVGGDASPWLRRALDECVGEHGPSTTPLVAGVRARVLQLEGNLAHLAGEGVEARGRYRAAAEDFARAGEGLGRVLVEGSLSSLAFEAGDLGEALSLGRRSLRGFLARAQVQTLPAALFNLVRALAAVGAVDEGRRLWRASMELCAAAGEVSALNQARLERVAIDLDAARPPPTAQARQGWRVELGARYVRCAASLEAAGVAGEAADAHLRATCMLRAAGRSAASSERAGAHLDGARRALDAARRLTASSEDAAGAGELAVRVGVAVESLALAPSIAALVETRRELAELPSPTALVDAGQAQLAWIYDRALLGALHRFGHVGDALSASVAGRLLNHLESFMNHASKLDRRSLRQSLLSEAGEAQPLRELVRELEAAEAATPSAAEPEPPSEPPGEATGEGEVAPSGAATPRGSTARRPAADRLSHLLRVFRRLSREDQLERLLEQIVEAMMELTDAERGVVCVGRGPARMEVAREMAWEGPQKGEQASAGEGSSVGFSRSVIEQVLASGEPVLSVDAASDDRFDGSRSISHLNLRSVLAVPLIFRGERLGAAYVDHRLRRGNFDAEDLAHMEDFADLAALAVAQARALAEVREQAATLERQRSELTELLASREAEVVNLREVVRSAPERREYRGMVGSSKAMQRVFRLVDRLASSEVPVVIYGESGTGKELVARAIHDAGIRAGEAFIAENCGAIPETLLESVLFGHARGAFTGAQGTRPGLFEAANGGTIFLDEIGETSAAMQTKLLRVLQEGEVRRLGENRSRKVDVRVIAASNRDLEAMVAAGTFRQDLYYRINVVKLELPALRERREDIPALVEHFLVRHGARVRARRGEQAGAELPLQVTASALRKLSAYPWPGNVRELENEVQRWLALCEDKVVVEDLSAAIEGSAVGVDDPDDLELRPRIERLERELIDRAMKRTNNNQTQAAKLLGLSRYGLQKKLKRFEESE